MESDFPVTTANMISVETLSSLLDAEGEKLPRANSLIPAIETVLKNLPTQDNAEALQVLTAKGLTHPLPDIRMRTVNLMIEDGLNRDDYLPFISILKNESERAIINVLVPALTEIVLPTDIPELEAELKPGTQPAMRSLAISTMVKHPSDPTVGKLLDALGAEDSPELIDKLQGAIANLAQAPHGELLLGNIMPDKPTRIQTAALEGLAKLATPAHFPAIFAAYDANDNKALAAPFKKALAACVSEQSLPKLFEALAHPSLRQQETALELLGTLKHPDAVEPLFYYLQTADTQYPEAATSVLIQSSGNRNIFRC